MTYNYIYISYMYMLYHPCEVYYPHWARGRHSPRVMWVLWYIQWWNHAWAHAPQCCVDLYLLCPTRKRTMIIIQFRRRNTSCLYWDRGREDFRMFQNTSRLWCRTHRFLKTHRSLVSAQWMVCLKATIAETKAILVLVKF